MATTTTDDGCSIYYELMADNGKPVLLFSNSLGTNLHMWDDQVEVFSEHFRLLRYDSRGHGKSGVPDGEYSIERLGKDVFCLLEVLDFEKVYYCGLSKGGMVGMWLATHHGDRLERAAFCNTAAYMGPSENWQIRIDEVQTAGMRGLQAAIIRRWFTEGFIEAEPDRIEKIREMLLATPNAGYAACCAAIRDMDQRATIASITVPVIVIAGSEDPATTPSHCKEISDRIPGAILSVIVGAAHLSNIQKTDNFNQSVLDFLTMSEG